MNDHITKQDAYDIAAQVVLAIHHLADIISLATPESEAEIHKILNKIGDIQHNLTLKAEGKQ